MIKSAIIHRPDREYCYSVGDNDFIVKIRAAHGDLSECILNYRDKYLSMRKSNIDKENHMNLVASDSIYDYYETTVHFEGLCLRYYFILKDYGGNVTYLGNQTFFDEPVDDIYYMFDLARISRREEEFVIPDWAPGSVVYQIFPERYSPDMEPSPDDDKWYQSPMQHRQKLGGTLKGITGHIPHLADLGVDAVYMTPIFKSPSDHKYNTADYLQIDPDFGSESDLIEMVNTAHSCGIKVILDGVFNHCDPTFFAFRDVMENQEKSEYCDWFYIHSFPVKWEMPKKFTSNFETPTYETFSYFGGMPKLNCSCPAVREYVRKVISYWMNTAKIDGWRLDVADEIGHDFWRFFRNEVKKQNPDALIIGEIWADAPTYLQGDEWDSIMNYRFYNAVRDCVANGKYPVSYLVGEISAIRGSSNRKSWSILWNLIGSHDTPRFLHLANEHTQRLKIASLLQFTMTGMPMIYYGDEYGMTGAMDPDCRRGMVWDAARQNQDVYDHYKKLIALRKTSSALKDGELKFTVTDDESGLLIYEKISDDERYTVAINLGNAPCNVDAYSVSSDLPGQIDLISESRFDGVIKPLDFVLIKI